IGTACAGIKQRQRDDLALIELAEGATAAAVFTQNRFRAPPVELAEARLGGHAPRLLLINSGNANAATGQAGLEDAEALSRHAAQCG
ncbi:MAG: bifunctional ornithine acetyltransferase/N-acetylglutamate synthase, partial [Gammaproteobacteria bacterium]|nr:bifunctional ornithine acetyltransferase/N-acetylglutamate synthase [Gammaproteobacteria bacterium]